MIIQIMIDQSGNLLSFKELDHFKFILMKSQKQNLNTFPYHD